MEKIVDAKGFACPQPVLMTKEALKDMRQGTLKVLVDNEVAMQNVAKLGKHMGFETSGVKKGDSEFEISIEVSAANDPVQAEALNAAGCDCGEEDCCQEESSDLIKKGLVVVLSSDLMGSGNDELGKVLMKGFVFALTKLERLPETVLLYNGGATLSAEGSDSLEDLKELEEQGVEILTCGTCLNYYGLSEKLKVGSVTNMYEIAEKLALAKSIVRP